MLNPYSGSPTKAGHSLLPFFTFYCEELSFGTGISKNIQVLIIPSVAPGQDQNPVLVGNKNNIISQCT